MLSYTSSVGHHRHIPDNRKAFVLFPPPINPYPTDLSVFSFPGEAGECFVMMTWRWGSTDAPMETMRRRDPHYYRNITLRRQSASGVPPFQGPKGLSSLEMGKRG